MSECIFEKGAKLSTKNGMVIKMKVIVETSARHIHLTRETFVKLFGEDAELTKKKDLSQPGQFACAEKVTVVGPRGELAMSILGPYRNADQVEVALTDARKIGITPPIRESGDLAGTPGCKLIGPKGEVEIENGVIAAQRHVHLTPEDAEKAGLKDKQIVSVEIDAGTGRKLVFGDVVCRVRADFATAMHIDTDESNAAAISGVVEGVIIP